jgi:hypothetical protein
MLEKGKIYRISGHALDPHQAEFWEINQEIVREDGWLWLWTGEKLREFYVCLSVATGKEAEFEGRELEAADGDG